MKKGNVIRTSAFLLSATLIATPLLRKKGEKNTKSLETRTNTIKVYDVGNHEQKKLPFEDYRLNSSNEEKDDVSVVITPTAATISGICDDVEYTKSLISEHKIGPVFLNVEPIINDTSLTISEKIELIKTYLEKTEENGIYVGAYGTNSSLYYLNQYYDIKKYDTYLISDDNENKYDGNSTFVLNKEGKLEITNPDIFRIIEDNNFNNKDNFTYDSYFIVNDVDSLNYIADVNNISIDDLLKYNDINYEDITSGTILRIPNKTQKSNGKINETAVSKGIDISVYQDSADWDKVKSNVDFVIIRATYGEEKDASFDNHYNNASSRDIPIGIYSYSYAETKEEMEAEAKFLVKNLKDKNITYPVYLDFEDIDTCLKMDAQELIEGITAWNKIVREAGFIPGIYTNISTYAEIYNKTNKISPNFLNSFNIWIAGGQNYDSELSFEKIEDPGSMTSYNGIDINCQMRQVSSKCTDIGIGNHNGYVDFNYCYVSNYNNYIVSKSFPTKAFTRFNIDEIFMLSGMSIAGILVGSFGIKLLIPKKRNKGKLKVRELD